MHEVSYAFTPTVLNRLDHVLGDVVMDDVHGILAPGSYELSARGGVDLSYQGSGAGRRCMGGPAVV